MAKYKVEFEGFAYVEADSEEEAEEIYEDNSVYSEWEVTNIKKIDEFEIPILLED